MRKKCGFCKKAFIPKKGANKRAKYCSPACRQRVYYDVYYDHFKWRKDKKCKLCRKAFTMTHPTQVYCSPNCLKVHWKILNREKDLVSRRKSSKLHWRKTGYIKARENLVEQTCINSKCGKNFTPDVRHPFRVACSTKCRQYIERCKRKERDKEVRKNPSLDPKRFWMVTLRLQVQNANYHAIKRGCKTVDCEKHHIHYQDWKEVKEKYGNRCAICKNKDTVEDPLTIDHIVALANGGHNVRENIQPACRSCNSRKGNRY